MEQKTITMPKEESDSMKELKEETEMWDKLSDEALENFENSTP